MSAGNACDLNPAAVAAYVTCAIHCYPFAAHATLASQTQWEVGMTDIRMLMQGESRHADRPHPTQLVWRNDTVDTWMLLVSCCSGVPAEDREFSELLCC